MGKLELILQNLEIAGKFIARGKIPILFNWPKQSQSKMKKENNQTKVVGKVEESQGNSKTESLIEAILFSVGDPVEIKKREVENILRKMSADFAEKERGVNLVLTQENVQLVSAAQFGKEIATFLGQELSENLSPAALETLAVVAYRGPLTRPEIEYIRGVNCSFVLRKLAMRGLIERKDNENDSRSYLYDISVDFLKSLGISEKSQLPDFEKLSKKEEDWPKKEEDAVQAESFKANQESGLAEKITHKDNGDNE